MVIEKMGKAGILLLVLPPLLAASCSGQVKERAAPEKTHTAAGTEVHTKVHTTFPQIHTNLNGMVREFVRTMHQDQNGNYWFGTNVGGIIRYDGKTLEKIQIDGIHPHFRVLHIAEDNSGNIWFGTSNGLIKYDGENFTTIRESENAQNQDAEIWGLAIDKNGLIWIGSTQGVRQYDGEKFIPFSLPAYRVEDAQPMLSGKLVFKIVEDRQGGMWLAPDGNGLIRYHDGKFSHITTKNGLPDNSVADILEDRQGNIWIGTFYGGVCKYDGTSFTNFTKDGSIEGPEAYNLLEDSKGNIWFSAEGYGVYRYDGTNFRQFTTHNGLTTNVVQSIYEDSKGQLWFGTWQGMCIWDGEKFVNASEIAPWTN